MRIRTQTSSSLPSLPMDWMSHWAAGSPSFIFRDTFSRDMFIIAGAFPIRQALAPSLKSLAERCAKPAFELNGQAFKRSDEARRVAVNVAKLPELVRKT